MRKAVIHFWADRSGSAAIEYSLVAGAIGFVVIAAIVSLSETLGTMYQTVIAGLAAVNGGG